MYLVIDIGSNTIRAVVFCVKEGKLIPILNKKYPAGLAGYVGPDGAMSREGIERCIDVLSEIGMITEAFSFEAIYPFATAAIRNTSNCQKILEEIKERCGLSVQLLTGKEEAFYDYYGTAQDLEGEGILTDIGGGSTEIVVFGQGKALAAESLHIGSLNLYHKHVSGLMPSPEEIKAIQTDVKQQLKTLDLETLLENKKRPVICGVGGTARSALKLYNTIFHQSRENCQYERSFLKKVLHMDWEQKEFTNLILQTAPDRIHTLLPGIAVLYTVAKQFDGKKIITASHGVREGYLHYQLKKEGILRD